MTYADLQALADYRTKYTGAKVAITLYNAENPSEIIIGATTGLNISEDFEAVPIEEAGNDGVDEHAQGRHTGSCTVPAFYTPEWQDQLPTRQSFKGKSYVVMARVAPGWPGEGTVLDVLVGCVLTRMGKQMGARGALTLDLAFNITRRYSGAEWAALNP